MLKTCKLHILIQCTECVYCLSKGSFLNSCGRGSHMKFGRRSSLVWPPSFYLHSMSGASRGWIKIMETELNTRIVLSQKLYQSGHSNTFWSKTILVFSPVSIILTHPLWPWENAYFITVYCLDWTSLFFWSGQCIYKGLFSSMLHWILSIGAKKLFIEGKIQQ